MTNEQTACTNDHLCVDICNTRRVLNYSKLYNLNLVDHSSKGESNVALAIDVYNCTIDNMMADFMEKHVSVMIQNSSITDMLVDAPKGTIRIYSSNVGSINVLANSVQSLAIWNTVFGSSPSSALFSRSHKSRFLELDRFNRVSMQTTKFVDTRMVNETGHLDADIEHCRGRVYIFNNYKPKNSDPKDWAKLTIKHANTSGIIHGNYSHLTISDSDLDDTTFDLSRVDNLTITRVKSKSKQLRYLDFGLGWYFNWSKDRVWISIPEELAATERTPYYPDSCCSISMDNFSKMEFGSGYESLALEIPSFVYDHIIDNIPDEPLITD